MEEKVSDWLFNFGADSEIIEKAEKLEAEHERYRMVMELIITRNKLMNPVICLDMLEEQAKRALGRA